MSARTRLFGGCLVALGILGILWGVVHVLAAIGSPEKPDFAHRLAGSVVRDRLHSALPGALARSLAGIAALYFGARLFARQDPGSREAPGE